MAGSYVTAGPASYERVGVGSIPPRAALGRVPLALPTACVALGVWVGTRDGWWAWLLVPPLLGRRRRLTLRR